MVPADSSSAVAESSADEYKGLRLYFYDLFVLAFLSTYVWRCPTTKITLPLFRQNVRKRHLDIGVGTGYFTKNGQLPPGCELTLCDLNPNCLNAARSRLGRPDIKCDVLQHDVYKPLPESAGPFDSISMLYLLHCMRGPASRKAAVFASLKRVLAPEGVVFGATILGERRVHTGVSDFWVRRCNKRGFHDNLGDTEGVFAEALRKNFAHVEARVVGAVFVFKASGPIL